MRGNRKIDPRIFIFFFESKITKFLYYRIIKKAELFILSASIDLKNIGCLTSQSF